MEQHIDIEKSRAECAEMARDQSNAELNLIRKQLDLEQFNAESCKKFLEQDELDNFEKQSVAQSNFSKNTELSVSEQMLMKYKRSNELREFFE